jgi:multisubunit Na+/H+ antiporter MnhB subunit
MMRRKIFIFILLFIVLFAGWFFFRLINPESTIGHEDKGFTAWLWEKRGLDLMVQVALVFAGALGIAAILPVEDENDD